MLRRECYFCERKLKRREKICGCILSLKSALAHIELRTLFTESLQQPKPSLWAGDTSSLFTYDFPGVLMEAEELRQ